MFPRLGYALFLPLALHAQDWSALPGPPGDLFTSVRPCGPKLLGFRVGGPVVSLDGGETWQRSASGLGASASLQLGEVHGTTALGFGSGGAWLSTDCGDSWHDWSEGLALAPDQGYYRLALGDTVAMLLTGIDTSGRLWRRTLSTPWSPLPERPWQEPTLQWTGKGFLAVSSPTESGPRRLRFSPDGLNFKTVLTSTQGFAVAARNDTAWALKGGFFFRSPDGGSTWDSLAWNPGGFWGLLATSRGLITRRNDSTLLVEPLSGKLRTADTTSDAYFADVSEQGGRIVLAGATRHSLVSRDSGTTWESAHLPEAGFLSEAVLRTGAQRRSVGAVGVWCDSGAGTWTLEPGSNAIHSLWQDGSTTYGGGWRVYRGGTKGWVLDTLKKKAKRYDEARYRVTGSGSLRWASDGDDLWQGATGRASWTTLDTIPDFHSSLSDMLAFGGHLWQTREAWRDTVAFPLIGYRIASKGPWSPRSLPHHSGGTSLAAGSRTLWVGTDSGLYRSDDTGNTFRSAGLPHTTAGLHPIALAARGDTVAVTLSAFAFQLWNDARLCTYLSRDGGTTWERGRDTSLVATAFVLDSTGILAAMLGRGLYRWDPQASTGLSPQLGRAPAKVTVRATGLLVDSPLPGTAIDVEVFSSSGRRLLQACLPAGRQFLPCRLGSGLRLVRLRGAGLDWSGTLLVP